MLIFLTKLFKFLVGSMPNKTLKIKLVFEPCAERLSILYVTSAIEAFACHNLVIMSPIKSL